MKNIEIAILCALPQEFDALCKKTSEIQIDKN